MILIDYNQMVIANFMGFRKQFEPGKEDVMMRRMVLHNIRMIKNKFSNKYGKEVVFCCDNKKNWRKDIYPFYKANRKKAREENKQGVDWQVLFNTMDNIRNEIAENMPYRVVTLEGCEADDIIGVICKEFSHRDYNILIVSSDKDFIQLQKYPNVSQWSPRTKKFIKESDPAGQLRSLIVKGDRSDGIPNILSNDDCFVEGLRQKPMSKKKIMDWLNIVPEKALEGEILRNFKRNETLIDLGCIPDKIVINIRTRYENDQYLGRDRMLNYFIKHRLKDMTESIQEF
jgi:5'-3' exonuclease